MAERKTILICFGLSLLSLSGCVTDSIEADTKARNEIASKARKSEDNDLRSYANCVITAAASYAIDPKNNQTSADDIADASVSKCALVLLRLQGDIGTELVAEAPSTADFPDEITSAAETARESAQEVRTNMRGQAVQAVINVRQRSSH